MDPKDNTNPNITTIRLDDDEPVSREMVSAVLRDLMRDAGPDFQRLLAEQARESLVEAKAKWWPHALVHHFGPVAAWLALTIGIASEPSNGWWRVLALLTFGLYVRAVVKAKTCWHRRQRLVANIQLFLQALDDASKGAPSNAQ